MIREQVLPFQGKPAKILLLGNFALNGIIEQVYDDSILFTTKTKTALIKFYRIEEICADKGGGR